MDSKLDSTTELLNLLSKATDSNMYGSIEVYLEDGQVTQITQRIIKKIKRTKSVVKTKKTSYSAMRKEDEIALKFQN